MQRLDQRGAFVCPHAHACRPTIQQCVFLLCMQVYKIYAHYFTGLLRWYKLPPGEDRFMQRPC